MKMQPLLLSVVKHVILISTVHLYILVCAMTYSTLEGFDAKYQPSDHVKTFLMTTDLDKDTNTSIYFKKYEQAVEEEAYWKIRHHFNSISKSYTFVLVTHTTLGNRNMMIQTWNGQLFYIFSAPIGVALYYAMLHAIAMLCMNNIKVGVGLVFRLENRQLTDTQREVFGKIKLIIAIWSTTILFALLLGLASLLDGNTYVSEVYYIIDVMLTVSSSKCFVYIDNDKVNAILSTLIYFTCLLLAYATMFSLVHLLQSHEWREIACSLDDKQAYTAMKTEADITFHDVWDESQSMKDHRSPSFTATYVTGGNDQ